MSEKETKGKQDTRLQKAIDFSHKCGDYFYPFVFAIIMTVTSYTICGIYWLPGNDGVMHTAIWSFSIMLLTLIGGVVFFIRGDWSPERAVIKSNNDIYYKIWYLKYLEARNQKHPILETFFDIVKSTLLFSTFVMLPILILAGLIIWVILATKSFLITMGVILIILVIMGIIYSYIKLIHTVKYGWCKK